jgi:hypothetical protein
MPTYYAQRPFTARTTAILAIFDEFEHAQVDHISPGKLVAPRIQSVRLFKGSALVARAYIYLDTAQYRICRIGEPLAHEYLPGNEFCSYCGIHKVRAGQGVGCCL